MRLPVGPRWKRMADHDADSEKRLERADTKEHDDPRLVLADDSLLYLGAPMSVVNHSASPHSAQHGACGFREEPGASALYRHPPRARERLWCPESRKAGSGSDR